MHVCGEDLGGGNYAAIVRPTRAPILVTLFVTYRGTRRADWRIGNALFPVRWGIA